MTALDPGALRRAQFGLRHGLPLDPADAKTLADALADILSGGISAGEALGVESYSEPPDLAARNELLRATAQKFWPNRSARDKARFLRAALLRYSTSAWPAESQLPEPPAHRRDTIESACWQILQISTAIRSERHLRRIVAMISIDGPRDAICRKSG